MDKLNGKRMIRRSNNDTSKRITQSKSLPIKMPPSKSVHTYRHGRKNSIEKEKAFHSFGFTDKQTGIVYVKTPQGFLKPITAEEMTIRRHQVASSLKRRGPSSFVESDDALVKKWWCLAVCHLMLHYASISYHHRNFEQVYFRKKPSFIRSYPLKFQQDNAHQRS